MQANKIPASSHRYIWADVLRGFAILVVVFVHTSQYGLATDGMPGIARKSILAGVWIIQLLYMLSAFTIFLTYQRHKKTEQLHTTNFYIRRFFRIAPMFYLAIVYYSFQTMELRQFWLGGETHLTVANILATVFFAHGVNPEFINSVVPGGWSVAVEMPFYLLVPILFIYAGTLRKSVVILYICLILKLALYLVLLPHPLTSSPKLWETYLYFYFPSQLPAFIFGIILFHLLEKKDTDRVALTLLSLPIILAFAKQSILVDNGVIRSSLVFLVAGLILSKITWPNKLTLALAHIGKMSFSIYLVHIGVLLVLERLHLLDFLGSSRAAIAIFNFLLRYLIAVGVSVVVANLTYKYIEMPFVKWGNKIIEQREAKLLQSKAA